MIRTTRLRRMTLQWRQIRFTDACTLIAHSIAALPEGAAVNCCARWPCYFARKTILPRVRS